MKFSTRWKSYPTKKLKAILDDHHNMNEAGTKDYGPYIHEIQDEYHKRMVKLDDKLVKKSIRVREKSAEEKLAHAMELIEAQKMEIEMLKRELEFAHKYFLPPVIDNTPF